jgi:WD40 repeat protein
VLLAGGITAALLAPWSRQEPEAPTGPAARPTDQPPAPPAPSKADVLARRPSPFDALRRKDISPPLLALAGGGDPARAPADLVAVLADVRFKMPRPDATSWPTFSPDGKLLAVPCGPHVALFDANTGALVRELGEHSGRAFRVGFSPDGKRLVVAAWGLDATATVWGVTAGKRELTLRGHKGTLVGAGFSPDGKRIVTWSDDGTARLWNAATGKEELVLGGHTGHVYNAVYGPGGRLYTSGQDGMIIVRDAQTGDELSRFRAHEKGVNSLVFSPDGKLLATGNDHEGKVWGVDDHKEKYRLPSPAAWLAFLPDGRALLAARHDHLDGSPHRVNRFDAATGKAQKPLIVHGRGGFAVHALRPDGKALFSMGAHPPSSRLLAYDPADGRLLFPLQGHDGGVFTLAVHPQGKTVASGGADRTAWVWSASTGKPLRLPTLHSREVLTAAYSPDGKLLATGALDGMIHLWRPSTGALVTTLLGHSRAASLLAFRPDGLVIAAGGTDGGVRFWDVGLAVPGRPVTPGLPLRRHHGTTRAVAFSPDGKLLASAGQDSTVIVGELPGDNRLHTFASGSPLPSVTFSPDGKLLAAGAEAPDCSLRIWDVRSGKATIARGHRGHVWNVAFHPGGEMLATASGDGTVRLWGADGRPLRTIGPGPFGRAAYAVAFSPEGRYLLTADANGAVCVFRLRERPTSP